MYQPSTTPVPLALAAAVGIAIVAVGGGGIHATSIRWDNVLVKYDEKKPNMQRAMRNAPSVRDEAQQAKQEGQRRYDQSR